MTYAAQLIGVAFYMLLLSAEPHAFAQPQQFTTTIFVCALETAPDKCDAQTAIDTAAGPNVENETMCGKLGQAVLAGTALVPREGVEYVKILCQRRG